MASVLLIIIYTAFIGLGIPDSLLGTAWPAVYTEFGIPVSYAVSYYLLVFYLVMAAVTWKAERIFKAGRE